MKIEQLLVQHLYNQREVTLQGIGSFTLSPDVVLPKDNDKDFVIPSAGLSFTYNGKAVEDDALIQYIVQQTRKIKPLASADLDSYIVLGRQFLNIGKPFPIEGIGTLYKNQQGEYEFVPGNFIIQKNEAAPVELKEKYDEHISFASEEKKGSNKKALYIIAGILVIGLAAWGGWYLLNKMNSGNSSKTEAKNETEVSKDTPVVKTGDTVKPVTPNVAQSSPYTFKIVFDILANKAAAEKRMSTQILRGHKVIMYTADSISYKLAEPFTLPLSDTTYVKDSLNRWYYLGKARVEL